MRLVSVKFIDENGECIIVNLDDIDTKKHIDSCEKIKKDILHILKYADVSDMEDFLKEYHDDILTYYEIEKHLKKWWE